MPTGLISLGRGARRESEIASNEEKKLRAKLYVQCDIPSLANVVLN